MKIEELSLCNLNSLTGTFHIRFNDEPFNGSGLFAVTGPTGAGKSTIFDAISLALYGRTPRLKNPDEIMSRHQGECFAELTFNINGERYRSRWEQRRSRGSSEGKLQSPKMSLVSLSDGADIILEERKSAVPSMIASITGLDYEQFTRSILLAQGDFASFLKAGINEKAELLEKMTGSEIYTRISIEAFNRARQEEEKLDRLKESTGNTEILDHESRKSLLEELDRYREERKKSSIARNSYEKARGWQEQEVLLKLRLENALFDLQNARERESESAGLEREYRKIKIVLDNLPAYESCIFLKKELDVLEGESEETENRLDKAVSRLPELEEAFRQSLEKREFSRGEVGRIQKKLRVLEVLDNSIQSAQAARDSLNDELTNQESNLKNLEERQKEIILELAALEKEKNEDRISLEENKGMLLLNETLPLLSNLQDRLISLGIEKYRTGEENSQLLDRETRKLEALHKNISLIEKEKPGDLASLMNIKNILLEMGPISKQFRECLKDKSNYLQKKNVYLEEYEESERKLNEQRSVLDKLLSLQKAENLKELSAQVRKHLHDGDVCPVCSNVYRSPTDRLADRLADRRSEEEIHLDRDAVQNEIFSLSGKLEIAAQRISNNEQKLEKCIVRLRELEDEWEISKGGFFPGLKPDEREKAIDIYQKNEQSIADCGNWQKEMEHLVKEAEMLKVGCTTLSDAQSLLSQMDKLLDKHGISGYSGHETLKVLEKKYRQYSTLSLRQDQLGRDIEKLEIRKDENYKETDNLAGSVNKLRGQINGMTGEIEKWNREKSVIAEGKDIDQWEVQISLIQREAEERENNSRENLNRCREEISTLLALKEKNIRKLPELRGRAAMSRRQLNDLLKNENLEESFFREADLAGKGDILKRKTESLREMKIRAEEVLSQAEKAYEDHLSLKPDNVSFSDLQNRMDDLEKAIEESSRMIGMIEEKISNDDKSREKLRELAGRIEAQERETEGWVKLRALIGSADGKVYRRFVQGLTLEKLVYLANIHLERLNKRYRIERSSDRELDVEIVDSWQADTVRPPSTLSGGESFLVSLALSLGLSEMVGNKIVIDSLFLDEGFGTLDPDSLETVLSALETLQSGGKLIGIISHIEAISERVPVQIKVRKISGGRSTIEIV